MSRHTYKPGDLVSIVLPETDYYYAKLLGHPARLFGSSPNMGTR